jgi:hypothetical protein
VDWNSDGQWDLMSGDVSGYLNIYIRNGDGLEAHEQYRLMDESLLDVGANSFPAVFDWNGDGMKDLIVGSQDSVLRFYLNRTSDTWPMFQQYEPVIAGDTTIDFRHANPCIFDLDEDGRKDLVVGHYDGYVHFFRNVGSETLPVFEAGETLRFEDGTPVRYGADFWWHSRCSFGDWDNDGTPDFLMTTRDGTCALFRGIEQTGVEERAEGGLLRLGDEGGETGSTIVRGVLCLQGLGTRSGLSNNPVMSRAALLDAAGRKVLDLTPGPNDVSRLVPGVYFMHRDHTARPSRLLVVN